jgi:hypothetical protein
MRDSSMHALAGALSREIKAAPMSGRIRATLQQHGISIA